MSDVRLAAMTTAHRTRLNEILRATGSFSSDEVEVALELFDDTFADRGPRTAASGLQLAVSGARSADCESADYEFVGAFTDDALTGYACFGPTPATDGTWDLYWLAVDPAAQGRGVGTALVHWVEQELSRRGARLLVVETSSRADYEGTRSFYARSGYQEAARVRGFYSPADDRIILTTRLSGEAGVPTR